MSATAAIFVDSYRQLNAKKLFWVTLGISAVVVIFYASIGFHETGMSMLFGLSNVESEFLNANSPLARMLYRGIFSTFIVSLWLAWVATILALISTTTIFPDFVAGGAIDLVLSKPITRVKLFVVKYFASLLFVLLQVGLFCVGVFLCMGWRVSEWNFKIFLAVPLVTVFYSYLYSVNVLVGVITRSALTALLVTLLFWFSLFGLNFAEVLVNQFRTQMTIQIERTDRNMEATRVRLDALPASDENDAVRARLEADMKQQETDRDETMETRDKLDAWLGRVRILTTILPKTSDTVGLLDRWLKEDTDINLLDLVSGNVTTDSDGNYIPTQRNQNREVEDRMQAEIDARPWWWIVGTSLAFELVVLIVACAWFVRRDY